MADLMTPMMGSILATRLERGKLWGVPGVPLLSLLPSSYYGEAMR